MKSLICRCALFKTKLQKRSNEMRLQLENFMPPETAAGTHCFAKEKLYREHYNEKMRRNVFFGSMLKKTWFLSH